MAVRIFSLIWLGVMICGCNTMEGLGRDVKKSGQSLEKAADRNKPR